MVGLSICHHPQGMLLSVRASSHGIYTSRFQHALQTSQERGLEGFLLSLLICPLAFINAYTSGVAVHRWVTQALLQPLTGDIICALSQA